MSYDQWPYAMRIDEIIDVDRTKPSEKEVEDNPDPIQTRSRKLSKSELADKWRKTAIEVLTDLNGRQRGSRRFKPTGLVREKMKTQVSILNQCADELDLWIG